VKAVTDTGLSRGARLRARLVRHRHLLVAAYLANNARWRVRHALGRLDTPLGSTHARLSVEESVQYVESVIADYRTYGGLSEGTGRAAELGPGDSAGVALLLRGLGYVQVDLVDRFASTRDPQHQAAVYRELALRHHLDNLRNGADWREDALLGVSWHIGEPAETFFRRARLAGNTYDAVVSRAVLQYLYDPLGCLADMVRCLAPGGVSAHKIDLRDHGLLTPYHHELSWLEIPSPVYRQMVSHSGGVNRVMLHRYRSRLDEIGREIPIRARLFVTHLLGVGRIEPHLSLEDIDPSLVAAAVAEVQRRRPRLAREFRDVSPQDLAVTGVFLSVQRLQSGA
jgi:SAM-dependent methyltransferase